jgi:type VI secretion system secreted protein VgrG
MRGGRAKNVVRCGLVTRAEALPADGGFAQYRLTIEPPFALLRHRRTSRVFQDMTVPEIVETILDEHIRDNPTIGATFGYCFHLWERERRERSYCLQYRETDLEYIERLLAEEGLAYRFEHGEDRGTRRGEDENEDEDESGGEEEDKLPRVTLVIFDNSYSLPRARQDNIRFHRASATESSDSITEWRRGQALGIRKTFLSSFDYKSAYTHGAAAEHHDSRQLSAAEATLEDFDAQTLYYAGDSQQLAHYARLRQTAHDREKRSIHGEGNVRELKAGEWFSLDEHPDYEKCYEEERQFIVVRLEFTAHSNLPNPLLQYLAPREPPLPPPYRIEFEAQPRGTPLQPAYGHTRHARPTARGLQTATVVGPEGEEVFTDELGRVKVQFHWQRPEEHPEYGANRDERSSCWLRVAYPSAGAGWGHQFLPRIEQEVLVDFIEGDIDRPIITGLAYNGAHPPPNFSGAGHLPANKTLSGIKTKEHSGVNYSELLFDDTAGQVRAKLSSEPGKTQLNLGYLIHPRTDGAGEPRGEGFELRTDLAGAIRAARGVLISARERQLAAGGQLDRDELIGHLETALAIARALGDDAETHDAEGTDTQPQEALTERVRHWEAGSNTDASETDIAPHGKAIVALTAPEGVAVASEANVLLASGASQDFVAAQDANHSVGQNLRQRVGRAFSLFVQQMSLKLIAAAGKIIIRALGNEIEIAAAKKLRLFSLEEIVLDAPVIRLRAQGAGVEYGGGAITSRATGTHTRHAASHPDVGPASVVPEGALNATPERFDQKVQLHWQGGQTPIANRRYRLHLENGGVLEGATDAQGFTQHFESELGFARYRVELLPLEA